MPPETKRIMPARPSSSDAVPTGARLGEQVSLKTKLGAFLSSPAGVVAVALILQISAIIFSGIYRRVPSSSHYGFPDEMGRIAESIASGRGFSSPYGVRTGPTALMPPVYPYLLAGVFDLFGNGSLASAFVILSLDSLFGALTCAFLLLIGRKIFGKAIGVSAAWGWVLWPSALLIPIVQVWYDSMTALVLAAVLWATLRLEDEDAFLPWAFYGVLWGVAALINPAVLAPLPFLVAWVCYRQKRRGHPWTWRAATVFLLGVLTVSPWLVRNRQVFGRAVFLRDGFGLQLYLGNHTGATAADTGGLDPPQNSGELAQYRRLGELGYMAKKQGQAEHFIVGHPERFIELCLGRLGEFWVWTGAFRPFGSVLGLVAWNLQYSLLPVLGAIGLVLVFRRRLAKAVPLVLVLISYPLVYVITTADPRYRFPIEPEMVLLAAYVIVTAARRLSALSASWM